MPFIFDLSAEKQFYKTFTGMAYYFHFFCRLIYLIYINSRVLLARRLFSKMFTQHNSWMSLRAQHEFFYKNIRCNFRWQEQQFHLYSFFMLHFHIWHLLYLLTTSVQSFTTFVERIKGPTFKLSYPLRA